MLPKLVNILLQFDDGAGKDLHRYYFPSHQDCTCEAQHGNEGKASLSVVQHLSRRSSQRFSPGVAHLEHRLLAQTRQRLRIALVGG